MTGPDSYDVVKAASARLIASLGDETTDVALVALIDASAQIIQRTKGCTIAQALTALIKECETLRRFELAGGG